MKKVILITGSTDGIGLETAKALVSKGHHVLIHGRNPTKLADVSEILSGLAGAGVVESYCSDLSNLSDVEALADTIMAKHQKIDVLINNAGVYKTVKIDTEDGLDVRFVVNTIAPFLLTQRLVHLFDTSGRIINLSSAAQSHVDLDRLTRPNNDIEDSNIYAQSKLGLIMWSIYMADQYKEKGPAIISLNPASLLGSKMVKEAYGIKGGDLNIGVDILCRAALSDEFANASGRYFDNDVGRFTSPHPDALNTSKNKKLVAKIKSVLASK
ncbi:SDR family NAD(P)-dependent oxidoreductase [Shewanella woodyi]|uniref:SDR family NAD(P)-dependent oxidoreductase n=1 Tax=Shewanella woodyi TaxID=60961 RepID=UPI0007F8C996|nr:SDR family NAD(P)-dependent oxidoreductase [Shewanella woodyi]